MLKLRFLPILSILAIIVLFIIAITPIIGGHINFWYDPARDLLLASDNLKKPTLIGVPSGIPGLFYGPFWIWFLSMAMILSKDPRLILFLVITIPYFIFIPLIFAKLSKKWLGLPIGLSLSLLFTFFFINNYNQIWNPNLAPLLFIIEIYIFYTSRLSLEKSDAKTFFLLGLIQGLLLNFHISFGLGILLSIFLYFIFYLLWNLRDKIDKGKVLVNWLINTVCFWIGLLLIFMPFFLFEARHGFNQIKTLFNTVNQAFLHNSAVVSQIGLSKSQIISHFLQRLLDLFGIPASLHVAFFIFVVLILVVSFARHKWHIRPQEAKLVGFLLLNSLGILIVYLTSKNPVWDYHFIAVEVIYLFLIGFMMRYSRLVKVVIMVGVAVIVLYNLFLFIQSITSSSKVSPDLASEKKTVIQIFQDANGQPFAYVENNRAIYTYEYDYIFKWLGQQRYHFVPPNHNDQDKLVYLIIPRERLSDKVGFVLNRTPDNFYETVGSWTEQDGTLVIKRRIKAL